jgi:hypothetical protein
VKDLRQVLGANRVLVPEYWVVRVLCHRGPWRAKPQALRVEHLNERELSELQERCGRGELLVVPSDSAIAEPVDVFRAEPVGGESLSVTTARAEGNAAELCRKMAHDHKQYEFRVLLVIPTPAAQS